MNDTFEKVLTVFCLILGSLLTYLSGESIVYHSGYVDLVTYTVGMLVVGAGIRAVLKS
jgi:hypothetical protein